MTTPTPAEQIRRFVEQHPGEWRREESPSATIADVLPIFDGLHVMLIAGNVAPIVWVVRSGGEHVGFVRSHVSTGAPLLGRVASRVADAVQLRGEDGCIDTLPPWLADPVRRELRRRAGELLTLAGSSPADVVSAAETLDEYLISRGVVEVTGILPTLLEVGMSCRWAKGYDESPDDYVGLVSRRLDALAGECETLRVTMKQAIAYLDAYERSDGREALAPINARAVLRRALGVA